MARERPSKLHVRRTRSPHDTRVPAPKVVFPVSRSLGPGSVLSLRLATRSTADEIQLGCHCARSSNYRHNGIFFPCLSEHAARRSVAMIRSGVAASADFAWKFEGGRKMRVCRRAACEKSAPTFLNIVGGGICRREYPFSDTSSGQRATTVRRNALENGRVRLDQTTYRVGSATSTGRRARDFFNRSRGPTPARLARAFALAPAAGAAREGSRKRTSRRRGATADITFFGRFLIFRRA